MEYNREEVSATKRKVTVTVPAEEVNAALGATLALYRQNTDMKGFRKGKVPSSLIESRYRKQIYTEASNDLINYHLNEIMAELKETPLAGLNMEGDQELVKGQDFSYSFEYEVVPQFDLPAYESIEVEEEEPQMVPEEVDKVIDKIRDNLANLEIVKDVRKAQDGDLAVFDFEGFENGEPLKEVSAKNFELHLGQGNALGAFEDVVKNLEPGQSGEGEVTFPDDFLNKDLAGKTVLMKVVLHAIKEKKLPEVNDDLAAKAGNYGSVQEMRDAIEKSYLESRRQLNRGDSQKKILDQLKDQVEFELPASMVEKHIDQMIWDMRSKMERQGKSMDSLGKNPQELRDDFRVQAEELTKSHIFLLAVANQEGIDVTPQEADAVLQKMAMSTGQDFNAIKDYYERNNLMLDLRDSIMADKAMNALYEKADVKMVTPQALEEEA